MFEVRLICVSLFGYAGGEGVLKGRRFLSRRLKQHPTDNTRDVSFCDGARDVEQGVAAFGG
jgi:hypothetical protein